MLMLDPFHQIKPFFEGPEGVGNQTMARILKIIIAALMLNVCGSSQPKLEHVLIYGCNLKLIFTRARLDMPTPSFVAGE
jgi:hypothetical protein